jgi:hypothetical protein
MVKTVLVLAANPIESVRFQFHHELSAIQKSKERSRDRDKFKVEFEPAADWDRWRQRLLDCKPEIVHFVGHGNGLSGLVLEGSGAQEVVQGDRFAQLLLEFPMVRCVVLNACHSKVQAAEIFGQVQQVRCVIGMKQTIAQESSREFAIAFYDGVFAGLDYGAACRIGKTGIASEFDDYKPYLLVRDELVEVGRAIVELEKPGRKMVLNSPFYIARPMLEYEICRALMEPGGLVCIKAPREFGKSSLMAPVIANLKEQGAATVSINFREVEPRYLQELDGFLKWFCRQIRRSLNLSIRVDEVWDEDGGMDACRDYIEDHVLPLIGECLVLELDEVDCLLDEIGDSGAWKKQFFWMLRAWFERGRTDSLWGRLRLVLVHSKGIGSETLEDSQSPFNVVEAVGPIEFEAPQIEELVKRHGLLPIQNVAEPLMNLVGGHPYLVRLALYQMAKEQCSIESVLADGTTRSGIYGNHLQHLQRTVERQPHLKAALRTVALRGREGVNISLDLGNVLRDLGVARLCGNDVQVTCELYRVYFTQCWS